MMRHVVDLSETIESVTEIFEANYVVTHSSQMALRVVSFPQRWRCWWWEATVPFRSWRLDPFEYKYARVWQL